jgi:glycosyltransferase involved in cell wall biosynthesis
MSNSITLVIAAPFPPPLHGLSAVVSATANALATQCHVVKADMSPGGLNRGGRYHLKRLHKALAAAAILARHAQGRHHLYLSVAGGNGNIYTLFLAIIGRILGYRIFLDHHSFNYLNHHNRLVSTLCWVAGRSTVHAVLSPDMGCRLKAQYPSVNTVAVVSNASRIPPDLAPHHMANRPLMIGHLSNLTFDKGLGIVLDLFSQSLAENLDVQFELAGPATGAELLAIETAIASGQGRLVWHGPLYDQDKSRFLRSLDVFCFPTQYKNEAQPLVLFEALACGVPVIAFGRGCIPEDIAPEMGKVIPVGDNFTTAALPLLCEWTLNRLAFEQTKAQAWASYQGLHTKASDGLSHWLKHLSTIT